MSQRSRCKSNRRGARIDRRLIPLGATARTLGLAEGTVRKWADQGKLPGARLSDGRRWFDREAIERIAAERAAQAEEGA